LIDELQTQRINQHMADLLNVIGVVGWKNSGKTRLVVDLVSEFKARNLSVSTVKHAHHGFDIDQPGKDSFQHREAGAGEVMIASSQRWALISEHGLGERPPLNELVAQMAPADVILAEGFKADPHPKLEICRDRSSPLIAREDRSIFAVVSPDPATVADCPCPVLARQELSAIADLLLRQISNAQ
jgi:molybdopterin-guanine dinucleotide biosynthesis protein MobB